MVYLAAKRNSWRALLVAVVSEPQGELVACSSVVTA